MSDAVTSRDLLAEATDTYAIKSPYAALELLKEYTTEEQAIYINSRSIDAIKAIWPVMPSAILDSISNALSDATLCKLSRVLDPIEGARLLSRYDKNKQVEITATLESTLSKEICELLEYPPSCAASLMNSNYHSVKEKVTVDEVLQQLKNLKNKDIKIIYVLDSQQRVIGSVNPYKLLSATGSEAVTLFIKKIKAQVSDFSHKDEIVDLLKKQKVHYLPVVNASEQLIGIIDAPGLIEEVRQDITADLQAMVGASRDEKALSSSWFAVKKRLPWLEVNLITAFLAAAVVGYFEPIIAEYTALAVLLPVVAGQSGNAGAQALAVTMRGLTLRELSTKKWLQVALKELKAGFINGLAISATCMAAVYIWSGSIGLTMVIGLSMVVAMSLACVSGAIIPIMLKKLSLDPASSSSIILTTVTDVAGFMAFLGIATILSRHFPL